MTACDPFDPEVDPCPVCGAGPWWENCDWVCPVAKHEPQHIASTCTADGEWVKFADVEQAQEDADEEQRCANAYVAWGTAMTAREQRFGCVPWAHAWIRCVPAIGWDVARPWDLHGATPPTCTAEVVHS